MPTRDQSKITTLTVHTDGGARGNPGPAAAAFIFFEKGQKAVFQRGVFLGKSTNNFAEYSAVVFALEWLSKNVNPQGKEKITFKIDSQLVVNQLNGIFKIKNKNLRPLLFKIKILENELGTPISYQYFPREQNFLADRLVNQTLDKATSSILK